MLGLLLSTYLVKQILRLRPSADDYCSAAGVARQGVLQISIDQYLTWSGDVTLILANNVLVGLPLSALPVNLSALPAQTIVIVLFAVFIAMVLRANAQAHFWKTVVFTPLIALSYWWLPATWALPQNYAEMHQMITSWQTVTLSYVCAPLASGILLFNVWNYLIEPSDKSCSRSIWVLLVPSGVIAMSGLSLSATWLAALSCMVLLARSSQMRTMAVGKLAVWVFPSWAIGFGISWFAPGLQKRRDLLDSLESSPVRNWNLETVLDWLLLPVLRNFAFSLFSVQVIFVVGFTFLLSNFFAKPDWDRTHRNLRASLMFAAVLICTSFFSLLIARLGQASTYEAEWHFIPSQTFILLAAVTVGLSFGTRRTEIYLLGRTSLMRISLFACCLAIVVVPVMSNFENSIAIRASQWDVGPIRAAPHIGDIESEWILDCWKDIVDTNDHITDRISG